MKGGGAILALGGLAAVAGLVLWSRSSAAKEQAPAPVDDCARRKSEMLAVGDAWIASVGEQCAASNTAACAALKGMLSEAAAIRDRARVKACDWSAPSPECSALSAEAQALAQKWVPALMAACPPDSTDPVCAKSAALGAALRPMAAEWLKVCAPPPVAKVPVSRETGATANPYGEALEQIARTGIGTVIDL